MKSRKSLPLALLLALAFQATTSNADALEDYGVRLTASGLVDNTTGLRWIDSDLTLGTASDLDAFLVDGWRIATTADLAQLLYRDIFPLPDQPNNPLFYFDFQDILFSVGLFNSNNSIPTTAPWACFSVYTDTGCPNPASDSFTQFGVFADPSVAEPGEPGLRVTTLTYLTEVPLYGDLFDGVCDDCVGRTLLVRDAPEPGADHFPARLEIADIITGDGSEGFTLYGRDFNGLSGYQVSPAGDINGDGIDDVFIGAVREDPNDIQVAGAAYVVYGRDSGFPTSFQLFDNATGTGEDWFRLDGIELLDLAGISVSSGDINGDGLSDLVMGALSANPGGRNGAGQTYVVFGQNGSFPPALQLSELAIGDGSSGFVLNGVNSGDQSGVSLAVGNLNDDDFDDVIVGTSDGETFVYYGRATGFPAQFELSALGVGDGSDGFKISSAGSTVLSSDNYAVGDVNGDTLDDLVIGASSFAAGKAYVVYGQTDLPAFVDLSIVANGTTGFVINGIDSDDHMGQAVTTGDFNADGIDDILVGAYEADPEGRDSAGESYLVYGRSSGFPAQYNLAELVDNLSGEGSVIYGDQTGSQSGRTLEVVGDINHDGYQDFAIASALAGTAGQPGVGQVHVIYGSPEPLPALIQLSDISNGDGSTGFVINGNVSEDFMGSDVNTAGDVNNDGVTDFIIGAATASTNNSEAGESYVIFGRAPDDDGDGVNNASDNCITVPNEDQRDTNNDGFGNVCDPDLNNDGIVNYIDIAYWVPQFNTVSDDEDFDGSGSVDFIDYSILVNFFLLPPGPSGLQPAE